MARKKATCSDCEETILLKINTLPEDLDQILALKIGEKFEHECPECDHGTLFTVVE